MPHENFIRRCIQLAENGRGTVSPNPLVGSVVVYQNKIIAEGWHQKPGAPHAERAAVSKISDVEILSKSTLYVNLEPCNHFGRTPPCTDFILEKGIKKVVIGSRDPHLEASGGIEKLRENGVDVTEGVLEKECEFLNRRFYTFHRKKRPYIILKWAQTQDGFLDAERLENQKGVNWITQPETQILTHQWRAEEDAILVGKNTVLNDNPSLTTRAVFGRNPIRLVLGRESEFPKDSLIFDIGSNTLLFSTINLKEILNECFDKNIQSILVEGGAQVLQSFLDENRWDEARILTGISSFETGLAAPKIKATPDEEEFIGRDHLKIFYR